MALFGRPCRGCLEADKHILRLQADRADDKEFIIRLLQQNQDLTDRILALAAPVSLREYRREPQIKEQPSAGPPRPRFPGLNPPRRPPGAHVYGVQEAQDAAASLDSVIRDING